MIFKITKPVMQGARSNSQHLTERDFWKLFKDKYHNGNSEFSKRKVPSRRYWDIPIRKGLRYYVTLDSKCARAELHINSPSKEWNKALYDRIRNGPAGKYCGKFGDEGRWPGKRASRIAKVNNNFKITDYARWNDAAEWLCGALDEIREATQDALEQA